MGFSQRYFEHLPKVSCTKVTRVNIPHQRYVVYEIVLGLMVRALGDSLFISIYDLKKTNDSESMLFRLQEHIRFPCRHSQG